MNPPNPQLLFRQATGFHQQGQLAEAERLYLQLIAGLPFAFEPRHMLGVLRMQQGRHAEALEMIGGALKINPGNVEALGNYGNVLKSLGRTQEAVTAYGKAVAIKPDFAGALYNRALLQQEMKRDDDALAGYSKVLALNPQFFEALHNRGILLNGMGRHEDALADFDKALKIRPQSLESWNNRGNALAGLGHDDQALESFDRAIAINPQYVSALYNRANLLQDRKGRQEDALQLYDKMLAVMPEFAEAWNNRGNALRDLGRTDEALASYDKALSIKPTQADALKSRAQLFFASGRTMDGIDAFARAAELIYGSAQSPPVPGPSTPPYKARHDLEQISYQAGLKNDATEKPGACIAGPAVRPDNHVAEISEAWRSGKPQIAVIDNLLTPQALEGLRRFCLESPVWRDAYRNGYLGAFPQHGFACPLLGQIADELSANFPAIFRDHPLLYMWGFKYDSQLNGIALHADAAAVNVNFWLTPDEANLDPESGGLVIWDVAAPLDWDFVKFNGDNRAIQDFLASHGAKPLRVPYRQNRAVIFDSDLFHETDTIRFRDGYLNRRINVTMLYGRRERAFS